MSYSINEKTHRIHGTGKSTYIYHKNEANVKQKSKMFSLVVSTHLKNMSQIGNLTQL